MKKRFFKCSTSLKDGRTVELLMTQNWFPATKTTKASHEGRILFPSVFIEKVEIPYTELSADDMAAVDALIKLDDWVDFLPE